MLSHTTEYALRAMVLLSGLAEGESVNSELIAQRTHVPQGYLSKVLRDLVVADLVTSQRGPRGGFCLARPPAQISMYDVVQAVDPFQRILKCPLGNPGHVKLCPLHRRIDDAMELIEKQFRKTSLAEVMSDGTDRCGALVQIKLPTKH